MPKRTRDDMLAASLMEGRKRKTETFRKDKTAPAPPKETPAAQTIPVAQTTKVQRSVPGLGFFRNLRQRDQVPESSPTKPAEETLNPADSVWQEDEDMDWAFVDAAKTVTPESEDVAHVARNAHSQGANRQNANSQSARQPINASLNSGMDHSDLNNPDEYQYRSQPSDDYTSDNEASGNHSGVGQGSLGNSQDESVLALASAVAEELPEEPKKKPGLLSFFKQSKPKDESTEYQSGDATALQAEAKSKRKGLFDFFKRPPVASEAELETQTLDLRSEMGETAQAESKLLVDKADAYSPYTGAEEDNDLLQSLRSTAHDAIDSMIASKWGHEPPVSQGVLAGPPAYTNQPNTKANSQSDSRVLSQSDTASNFADSEFNQASTFDEADPFNAVHNSSEANEFAGASVAASSRSKAQSSYTASGYTQSSNTANTDMLVDDEGDNPILEFDPVPVKTTDATLPGVKKTNWDIDDEEIVSITEADVLPAKQTLINTTGVNTARPSAPKPKTSWDVNDEEMESTPVTKHFELPEARGFTVSEPLATSNLEAGGLEADDLEADSASKPGYEEPTPSYVNEVGLPEAFAEPSVRSTQERLAEEKQTNFSALMTAAAPETTPRVAGTGGVGFKDIPVAQKLALIAMSLLLPIGLLLYFAVSRIQQDIAFAAKERVGVTYLPPLKTMQNQLQEFRAQLTNLSQGDEAARVKAIDATTAIETQIGELTTLVERQQDVLEVGPDLAQLGAQWQDIKATVDFDNINMIAITPAVQTFIEDTLAPLVVKIADKSNLTLDPEVASYYLQNMLVNEMTSGVPRIGALRTVGRSAIADGTITEAERVALATTYLAADDAAKRIFATLERAKAASPFVTSQVAEAETAAREAVSTLLVSYKRDIVDVAQPTITFEEASAVPAPRASIYALYDTALTTLDQVLEQRIGGLQRQNWLTLAGVAASLLLALAIIYFITRQITRPLSELSKVSERLAQGDFSELAKVEARDEIGQLASSFNQAIVQLRIATSQQEEELGRGREMQQNIGQFLDVAQDIAQGDLTKRGEVTNDVLGNVVDAINLMTEEFAVLLQDVQVAATSVNEGSDEVLLTSDEMSDQARLQVAEAQKARDNVLGVAKGIRWMAQNASTSAEAAQRTLQASQLGQQAVSSTLRGMQTLRQDVQGVSTRVQQLGKRSQEISEIVETISDIASQTNLLALGAALEAAGAGESGRRFSVVADEVGTLAERSAQAAQRVSALLAGIQREVTQVISEVERSAQQAEQGYQIATQAGQRLEEIADISQQSAMLAETISQATSQQVLSVEQVGTVIQGMAGISEDSQRTILQGREAAQRVRVLAEQLNDSLSRFRLS